MVVRAAGWRYRDDHDRGCRQHRGRRDGRSGLSMPPETALPCPVHGGRLRETVVPERPGPVRHAGPVRAPDGRVVGAGTEYLPGKSRWQRRLRWGRRLWRDVGVSVGHAAGQRPPEALVARDRLQPGMELVRVAEPAELGPGDDERVLYRVGRDLRGQRIAVLVEGCRVPVQGRGEPVQFACRDRRGDFWVVHISTVVPAYWTRAVRPKTVRSSASPTACSAASYCSSGWSRGAGLAGGDGAGQDPKRGPQRAFGDYREDGGVLPALLGRGPVVVGRHERAFLDWL